MSIRGIALAVLCALAPASAMATTVSGFFQTPPPPLLFNGVDDFIQGSVKATALENFNNATASFTTGERLFTSMSLTVNPYRTNATGTLLNSISVSYTINGGPAVLFDIIKTGLTGSASLEHIILEKDDVFRFFVNGIAGPSGNEVTFNVFADGVAPIPLPAGGLLLIGALGGLSIVRRRRTAAPKA
ncbi:VPLPA-CTERM sorting domain-containing protein [Puniceibacterium confluentis]|uniref:VPLPA-CTERM sorting domain-containing protein n=1 Tax=Puniceibacterium confluentis TaxID=1958944 RepID=UPI0011B51993|nr:VPLPA-CTERM sorting domain-containing protein [Puniceibacterium confluentis]